MDGQPGSAPRLDEATARSRHDSVFRPDPGPKIWHLCHSRRFQSRCRKVAAADPYTAAGFCVFDLYEWEVHQIMGAGPFSAKELQAHR
jgi:hypothetical protein